MNEDRDWGQWADMDIATRIEYVTWAVGVYGKAAIAGAKVGATKNSILSCANRNGVHFMGINGNSQKLRTTPRVSARGKTPKVREKAEPKRKKPQGSSHTSFNRVSGATLAKKPTEGAGVRASPASDDPATRDTAEARVWARLEAMTAWDKLPDAPEPVELWQVPKNGCTWPLWRDGDNPRMFCGCEKNDRILPYCDAHIAMAGGMKTTPQRRSRYDKRIDTHAKSKFKDVRILDSDAKDLFG